MSFCNHSIWLIKGEGRLKRANAIHEKVEADEPYGNWRITVVQSECKTELTYHVVECISFNDKKRQSANNASNIVCAC